MKPPSSHMSSMQRRLWWGAAALCMVLTLWWPGDIKWMNDEPQLLHNAYQANQQGTLARHGLQGSQRTFYGPMPTWIYQGLLLITHDLILVAMLKTLLMAGATLLILYRLAFDLRWPPWPSLLFLASPMLYFFNRMLWDNVHLIPMSACLVWLVVRFALRPNQWLVFGGLLLSVWMFYTHLTSAPMIAGWAVGMLWVGLPWFRTHWKRSLVAGILAVALIAPYIINTLQAMEPVGGMKQASRLVATLGAVKGYQFFTAQGLAGFYLPSMFTEHFILPPTVMWILWTASMLGVGLLLCGLCLALRSLYAGRLNPKESWTDEDAVSLSCLIALVCLVLMFFVTRQHAMPQYFNGVWCAFFWFIWLGVRWLGQALWGKIVVGIYATALVLTIGSMALYIHQHGGNRKAFYGHTLTVQIEAAKQILAYDAVEVKGETTHYKHFPFALDYLLTIMEDQERPAERPTARITVTYRSADPQDAHLKVIAEPVATPTPTPTP